MPLIYGGLEMHTKHNWEIEIETHKEDLYHNLYPREKLTILLNWDKPQGWDESRLSRDESRLN